MTTAIRGKDWVFNALWAVCGSAGSNANSSCILSIPVTFLFKDGMPSKAITTESSTGKLKKVFLEDIIPDMFDYSDGFRGESLQPLRALRKLLDDYSMEHGYYRMQNISEPYITKVIYTDDESENLTASKLDRLLRNDAWRQQVLLMQGYVPTLSIHTGVYSKQPYVRSKLDSTSNEAADQFSRSIAKYIEKAYMLQSDQLIPSRVNNSSSAPKVVLHVENMTCVFGLDPDGQVIFLHTDYIAIEMDKQNDRLTLENDLKSDKQQRELSAMETIQQELLNLLVHAHERGLSMEQSFYHFDVNHYGFIDVNTLLEGLAKLGIGVTFPIAQQLLQSMSGIGSHFITFNDFELFLSKGLQAKQQLKGDVFDASDVSTSPSKKSIASTKKAKKVKELLPPEKDQTSMSKYALDLSMSQSQTWEHTDLLRENEKLPLALPEDMYTTATGGKKRLDHDPAAEPFLAPWAAKRSYRALEKLHEGGQELLKHRQNQEQLATKKRREEAARKAANPFGNPQEVGESDEDMKEGEETGADIKEDLMKSFDTEDTPNIQSTKSSTKRKKQKSSSNLSRSNTANSLKLNLQTIHDQNLPQNSQALNHTTAEHGVMVNNYLKVNQDEILHIDHGVMMTYRILYGDEILSRQKKTQELNEDLRYHSIMTIREQNIDILEKQKPPKSAEGKQRSPSPSRSTQPNVSSSSSERKSPEKISIDNKQTIQDTLQHLNATLPVNQCFTLFIIPDLMMTLDTLQLFFMPLLRTHPYLQIVLVGLIGLPNTVWPQSWVINADLQSKCIAHLMKHLFETQQIVSHHLDYLLPNEMIPGFTSLAGSNTLEELKKKIPTERRVITVGFGTGGYYLARFLGIQFPVLSNEIKDSIIQVTFVNSFLKMNKKLKQIYYNLRQALTKANIYEAHELILSLHFYEPNINQPTGLTQSSANDSKQYRQEQLLKFWSTRKLLQQAKDNPNEVIDPKQKKKTIQDLEVLNGFGFKGILEQLKGLIVTVDDFDGATILMNNSIPIIVVQGTENIFIDPKHAAIYSPQQLPPNRRLIENVADTIDPNSIYMIWLKAGHEIIQERNVYILSLLSNLLKLQGVEAHHYESDEMKKKSRASSPESRQVEEVDAFDISQSPSAISESMVSSRSNSRANKLKRGSSKSARLLNDDEKDMYGGDNMSMGFEEEQPNPEEESQPMEQEVQIMSFDEAIENPEDFLDEEDEDENDPLAQHKADKERKRLHKQRLLLERKKKQLKQQRQSELEIFYQREQEAWDQQHEFYERKKMSKEDYRSKCAAEYFYQCEINEASKLIAKEKAQEMKYWKKQEAVLKIEEEMNKKRCERIEQRKKQVMSIVEKIVEEEAYLVELQKNFPDLANEKYAHSLHHNLPGAKSQHQLLTDGKAENNESISEGSKDETKNKEEGPMIFEGRNTRTTMIVATPEFVSNTGITNLLNTNMIITTSYGLLKEFMQLRVKYLQSIQRNQIMNEKYQQFLSQLNACEYEEKRLLRAIRLIEINPSIVGAEHQAKSQLTELQHSLQLKQDIIMEMKNISKQRAQEVYVNNRSVQLLKIAHYEFNLYVQTRLQELHTISTLLLHQLKLMKFQKETLTNAKNQERVIILQQTMRIDSIEKELKRCRSVTTPQVDTDIWNPGIMQRYHKQELMAFLYQECKKLRELQQVELDKLSDIKQQMLVLSDTIALKRRDQDKIQHSVTLLTRFYQEIQTSKSIENLIEQMNTLYSSAELQEKKKKKDFDMQKETFMQNKQTTNFDEFQGKNGGNPIGPDGKPNPNMMSKIDKLRLKDHELRSKEEKQMIGIDLILYPENYFHLSSMESEQMSYDDAYACHLLKGDLERIMKLPDYVNLALPFLFTQEEIHVHYLINKFYRNRDANYFVQLDYYSYDTEQLLALKRKGGGSVASGSIENGTGNGPSLEESSQISDEYSVSLHTNLLSILSQSNIADAEMIHEILLKESLRNRLRSAYLDESLTEDERHFIVLDRILFPHVYGIDDQLIEQVLYSKDKNAMNASVLTEGIAGNPSTEKAIKGLNNSVYKQASIPGKVPKQSNRYQNSRNKKDLKASTSKEGDMYEMLREHFQSYQKDSLNIRLGYAEEDLFHYHWSCPYNKQELLELYKTPAIELSDDQKYIKEIMNRYYISDEETIIGFHACEVLEKYSHKVIRMMQKLDKRTDAEMKQNREVFDADVSVADILPKQTPTNEDGTSIQMNPSKDAATKKSVRIRDKQLKKAEKDKNKSKGTENKDDESVTSDLSEEEGIESKLDPASSLTDNYTNASILTSTTIDQSVEESDIRRIFGSWQTVHPASQGKESQTGYFMISTFNAARDNPASFALHNDITADDDSESSSDDENALVLPATGNEDGGFEESKMIQAQDTIRQKGMDILMKNSVPKKVKKAKSKHPSHMYSTFENSTELAQQDPLKLRGKIVLLQEKEPMILFEVKDAMLQARQSKSHYFSIPNRENLRVVDLTVSILYQGVFTNTGYKLGRLAGSLFRLPEVEGTAAVAGLPRPVGYTPYDSVAPNLPNSIGRLVVFHKPKVRPITPGNFQIVIGTAAQTKYSIQVMAKYAKAALPVVDDEVTHAKTIQSRLPVCLYELDTIIESIQLSERKLLVCEKLIEEAESEALRCQESIKTIRQQLIKDDEELFLLEDERKNLIRECNIFEIEYSQWTQLLASRHQEKTDIRDGITEMITYQREHEQEKQKILEQLEKYRHDLPACIRILRNMTEAMNVAQTLNTIVQSVSEEIGAAAGGDYGAIKLTTPAEDVRRVMKQYGFDALHLEEQQWCLLDQAVNPNVYDWLREQEEQEKILNAKLGKRVKQEKSLSPALEPFKMSKSEVEYILQTPFSMLTRREMIVRKLLTKYHDDHDKLKRAIASVNLAFDPHLAENVRAKHLKSYTKEEQEWSTIDRILHPEIWNYYVHRSENFLDRHAKDADLETQSNTNTKKTTKEEKKALLKNLQAKQAADQASLDESSITSDGSSTITGGIPPAVITLDNPDEDFQAVIERMQKQASITLRKRPDSETKPGTAAAAAAANANQPWACQLDKQQILKVWRTPKHLLLTDDERRIYKLLHKFNGSYTAYASLHQESNQRKEHFTKIGSHIQWEKLGKLISKDSDFRARQLYREIDRAANTKNDFIHSEVLHMNDQKFPTKVLRQHLEEALDHLLSEQIKDRERAAMQQFRKSTMYDVGDDEATGVVDPQDKRNDMLVKEEKAPFTIDGINDKNKREDIFGKVQKLSEKREKRKVRLKEIDEESEVLQAKKQLFLKQQEKQFKKEQKTAILKKILQNELITADDGPSQKSEAPEYKNELQLLQQYELSISCLACRTRKCSWRSFINFEILSDRLQEINNEIERVRMNKHANVFESEVPLSTQLGGNKIFTKGDLLQELYFESKQINLQIELNNVDKELHDCYATRKEYFESQFLHGYKLLLWTNHARIALEGRQSRLVAKTVAYEIVEDILESMLEGWVFGERESEYQVLGYVPSIKKNGFIHPGQDQISSVVNVIEKMKKRAMERKQKMERSEEVRGKMLDKVYEIELRAQENTKKKKVARDNNEHEHLLNETESTLRFGLFMLTLMYFRAMVFLKREQSSWDGNDDAVKDPTNPKNRKVMTNERIKMLQEEHRIKLRQKKIELILAKSKIGEARKQEREKNERREAIRKLQAVVRRQKLEVNSITLLQKVYRGHLGRKAAKRWALKRAELQAMNALLNATAITIQRLYRGYRGRLYTTLKRQEMAQFIALMRVQEAQQDEEIYWQTHPWSRFKKKQGDWFQAKLQEYQTRGILGASRLQADELAELEGKTIDQIRRELDGLDASDDEGGGDNTKDEELSGYQGGGSFQKGKDVFGASGSVDQSSVGVSSYDASEVSSR